MKSPKYFDQIKEIFALHAKNPLAMPWGIHWSDELIQETLEKQKILLEVKDDNVLGFILYRELEPKLLDIDMTMTHPNLVKKGIMQSLFQRLKDTLLEGTEVWLEVHENNAQATNLYKKQGFNVVGRRPNYYPGGGSAILMSLKITQKS